MRSILLYGCLCALSALVAAPRVLAASLQASPVLVEMSEKAPSAIVTIRNTGDKPIEVQTRVMRWSQSEGQESLDEAEDVVASPPMITLKPGTNYAVRIVRTGRGAVEAESAYRVLVDQLPDATAARGSVVALVMRHSIPVFIAGEGQGGPARVRWELASRGGRLVLRATNSGQRRLRLAQVSVKLGDGRKVSFGNGLLGYVLAGSTMEWVASAPAGASGGTVSALTDLGPLSAQAHAAR